MSTDKSKIYVVYRDERKMRVFDPNTLAVTAETSGVFSFVYFNFALVEAQQKAVGAFFQDKILANIDLNTLDEGSMVMLEPGVNKYHRIFASPD